MPITKSFAGLSGFGFGILPFADMESIATVTVGSGGAANIEFTNIPGTFQHLQIRLIGSTTAAGYGTPFLRLNSDSGNNYSRHQLYGIDGSVGAAGQASQSAIQLPWLHNSTYSTSFGGSVTDILDYANTSKYTTVRTFGGVEVNVGNQSLVGLLSGAWLSTSAVTSITLLPVSNNFRQHTTAALYGIKAP